MSIKLNKQIVTTRGISLIEVLIAIVILSVGLLAIAAMQMNALQNTSNTGFRTQAIMLVSEMADKMQSNYQEVMKDAKTTAYDPVTDNCSDTKCSTARTEFMNWITLVQNVLPDGQAIVCRDSDHSTSNEMDSNGSGSVTNDDDPCNPSHTNICDAAGTVNDLSPYVIRVCWTESGGRWDMDGDGDIDGNDRLANQIIKKDSNGNFNRILREFSITLQ